MVHAHGSFDIKMTPAEPTDFGKANDITRFTSEKTGHGDFEGVSHGLHADLAQVFMSDYSQRSATMGSRFAARRAGR